MIHPTRDSPAGPFDGLACAATTQAMPQLKTAKKLGYSAGLLQPTRDTDTTWRALADERKPASGLQLSRACGGVWMRHIPRRVCAIGKSKPTTALLNV